MSRIFLSHSSADEREAVALKQWLAGNGWNDVFLDVDPQRGLAAGERWQEALRQAADRCEAVVFIVSPAWAKSKWCLAEFLLAKSLHKLIFGVVLKEVPIGELPTEMTAEWQLCRLVGSGSTETIRFNYREAEDEIAFLVEGLLRLREGLRKAGLTADFFPWPPKDDPQRASYRGLEPLEARDAAVFFGRDVEILRGLDAVRGMRDAGDKKLFVILGASGAGKSSFLRAGLLPRLARDDRHFFPLAPIRPEREPLFGKRGLAHALHRALAELKLPAINLGDVKARLRQGPSGLAGLIRQLQDALCARLLGLPEGASPPTLVLPVDQAEELFNADAGEEARNFLRLIGAVLREDGAALPMIVAFTIRSDRYEPLQTALELAGLQSVVFDDLKPMPPTRFREVILGPAQRVSAEGKRLKVEPELVERLVGECTEGGDALPLLGLTLARLHRDYGGDGDLRLDEYEHMGGLANIVKTEAESVLAREAVTRAQQLDLLHAAFVPWLATINPHNDQPMRRLACRADLPADSHALLDALAEKRLLLTDRRDGVAVIEVAHEALLRQWDVLADWLASERENLKGADVLERAVQAWEKSGRKDAWLMEGERLATAEALAANQGFSRRLEGCREFLLASRRREDAWREDEERRRQAELEAAQRLAAEQERRAEVEAQARQDAEASAAGLRAWQRRLIGALAGVVVVAVAAAGMFVMAKQSEQRAKESSARATALRLAAEAQAMLSGARNDGDERAMLQLLAGDRLAPGAVDGELQAALENRTALRKLITLGDDDRSPHRNVTPRIVAISPDGNRIAIGDFDNFLRVFDAKTGHQIGESQNAHGNQIMIESLAFSRDGSRFVSGGGCEFLLWDATTGQPTGVQLKGHTGIVTVAAFSPEGSRIVSGSRDGELRFWDTNTGKQIGPPRKGDWQGVDGITFVNDGSRFFFRSYRTLFEWDVEAGRLTGKPQELSEKTSKSLGFSPEFSRFITSDTKKDETIGIPQVVEQLHPDTLSLRDAITGSVIGDPLKGHQGEVVEVAFSPDGSRLATGSKDKTLRIWDAKTGQQIGNPLEGHRRAPNRAAFSSDGSWIVSSSDDDTLRVWATNAGQSLARRLRSCQSDGRIMAISHDGLYLAILGDKDAGPRLCNAKTGQWTTAPLEGDRIAAFSFDGTRIVTGSNDNTIRSTVRLWDTSTGQLIAPPLDGGIHFLDGLGFSPDGTQIIALSDNRKLRRWDARTGQSIGTAIDGPMTSVTFSSDGSRIAAVSDTLKLRVWDAKTGRPTGQQFGEHDSYLKSIAISPDATRIVSASSDELRIWDVKTGEQIGSPFRGHSIAVWSAAFSADGNRIVSGGEDNTVRLWDARTGQPVGAPFLGHKYGVHSVAFSVDGKQIFSRGYDEAFSWPAPAAWPDELCAKLTRNMSRKQWREWVSPDIDYKCQCPGLSIPPDDPKSVATKEICPGKPAESMFPLERPPT